MWNNVGSTNSPGHSSPTANKGFDPKTGYGKGNDKWYSIRAGIGKLGNGHTTPESGNQTKSVSDIIGNSNHFHVTYNFDLKAEGGGIHHGEPYGAEVTAGYGGSNNDLPLG
jgi:hypothetical protein